MSAPAPRAAVAGQRSPGAYVLAGGLVAGTCDIVYACTFWAIKRQVSPQRILQSVASGLLGKAAFEGGGATAALGLFLHFFIATSMPLTSWLVARRWPLLWQRPVPCGEFYGILLYGIMNYIVLPLSAFGPTSKDPLWIGMSIAVHMFLIGLPIALVTSRVKTGLRAED